MKFHNNEASFAFNGWSVSIYRNRFGNRMEGRSYRYSFRAYKLEKSGDRFQIIATVSGKGSKTDAINAIKQHDDVKTSVKTTLCTPYSVDIAGAMLGKNL